MDLSFSASPPSSSLCIPTIPYCSSSQLHKNPVRPTSKSALFCSLRTSLQSPFPTSFNTSPFRSISGRPISPKLQIRTPKRRHSARFAIWKQCTCDTSLCNLKRQQTMIFAFKEPRLIEHNPSHTWGQARSSFSSQDSGACSQIGATGSDPLLKTVLEFKDAFWRFLRPHTIRGTALGSTALVTRALIENSYLINWWLLPKALFGLLALICGNGYIVGINQIYDIGIDKVNKPYLPIAAGDLSVQSAWFLVLLFAVAGLLIVGLNFGPFISSLYCLGLFLGTIYSVPPFRLKRFAVAAFLIVATVRGFLLNFGVYYATRAALGLTFEWSPPVAFITVFVTIFALVIAITKDLPDVEGDRKFQISTLATKLGVRNIAFLGSGLLLVNYVGAIVAAVYMPQAFRRSLMIPAHTILALVLIFQAWILERANHTKEAISGFYRFIWNLFYAEYVIFPVI